MGHSRYEEVYTIRKSFYKKADWVLLMYSINDKQSFQQIQKRIDSIDEKENRKCLYF